LARPSREVTVFDVVAAVQGEVLDVPHVTGSVASALWSDVAEQLEAHLRTISLAELAQRQRELDGAAVTMYWI
jgi:DNA-binding IscR family transcriptional regulator